MENKRPILAVRLGTTVHESSLWRKLMRLSAEYPSPGATACEDWLVDVANARGARIVTRHPEPAGPCSLLEFTYHAIIPTALPTDYQPPSLPRDPRFRW